MKKSVYGFIGILAALCLGFTACGDSKSGDSTTPGDTDIGWSLSQVGGTSGSVDTTHIQISFDAAVTGLTLAEISSVSGAATKSGAPLVNVSDTVWRIPVTVSSQGNASVSISKAGVVAGPKTVTVYKNTGGTSITVKPGININRSESTTSGFVFNVTTVPEATSYGVKKGATEIATSTTTKLTVPNAELAADVITPLTAYGKNSAGDGPAAGVPGMRKYDTDISMNGYNDWIAFLQNGINELNPVALDLALSGDMSLMNALSNAYSSTVSGLVSTVTSGSSAESIISSNLAALNGNMEVILDHWGKIPDKTTMEGLLPKVWFNFETTIGTNAYPYEAKFNNFMLDWLDANGYPDVETIN